MFTVEQKTREIGIRKIFGGSGYKIFITIIRDFFPWILVSIMIASPLAYFAVLRWLETFAYNKAPDWKIFVYTAGIVLLSGIITIGYQVNKAMKINPVKALKYE
jgi:putative ABC transport system permease protein